MHCRGPFFSHSLAIIKKNYNFKLRLDAKLGREDDGPSIISNRHSLRLPRPFSLQTKTGLENKNHAPAQNLLGGCDPDLELVFSKCPGVAVPRELHCRIIVMQRCEAVLVDREQGDYEPELMQHSCMWLCRRMCGYNDVC